MPLKSVSTLARTMLPTLRLLSAVKALVRPAATRSATSAAVSPRSSAAVFSSAVTCSMRSL